MKRNMILILLPLLLALGGCWNDNEIEIRNDAPYAVDFNFRAEVYRFNAGQSGKIGDAIPNQTFVYSTTYSYPESYKPTPGEGLSGSLTFKRGGTKFLIQYTGYTTRSDSTYTIFAAVSCTDGSGSVTPTAP